MFAHKILIISTLVVTASVAQAQLIVDDFDDQTTGLPPAWLWWNSGSSGTTLVDETTFHGTSGKSVKIRRTQLDGQAFGFGRNFQAIDGPVELTFSFRVGATTEETLTVVGGNNAGHQVAWWVGVGGAVGNAIGTHSHSEGWNHVMDVEVDTWYGVDLDIDPASLTYDITVWNHDNPIITANETGIPFRDGAAVEVIDQIQFGNFSPATAGSPATAFIDNVSFIGARLTHDGFESANTGGWSSSTRPLTVITTCEQVVTTDAVLTADLSCPSGVFESAAVVAGASNITIDLMGHTITGHPIGIGVSVQNVDGVTIKNGTVKNFMVGIDHFNSNTITLEDLWVGNLVEDDPDIFLPGIRITESQDVTVRNSFFEFLPVEHKEAIVSATSLIVIDNVEVDVASVGVNFSGAGGSTGRVTNSRIVDTSNSGILVYGTDNAVITDNEFARCPINIAEQSPGTVTGLLIERNFSYHWGSGIHFRGGSSSIVRDNLVQGHIDSGIVMDANDTCPFPPTLDCFYAIDNLITGNTATDNSIDLRHHPNALGNTWIDNVCETTDGVEIPPCIPPTP